METFTDRLRNGTVVLCEGEVRCVPLSPMQAHRTKLQQRYSITTFKDGEMASSVNEWRDVPTASE